MNIEEIKTDILYCGDNLEILRKHIPDDSVDLIYLDPPFCSNRDYRVAPEANGMPSGSGIKAFSDTWSWGEDALNTLEEIKSGGMSGLGRFLEGITALDGPLAAYLVMMTPRLLEIKRVLKDTGSVYLHCNTAASHYLKLLMDMIFGPENFRNEIIWSYKGGGRSRKHFARKHDTIFFYTGSHHWTFNYQDVLVDRTNRTYFTDKNGERYWLKYGKKYYLKHDGKVPEDCWADIEPLHGPYKERLGYPTQKPLSLLERIIKASSNEGDIILDPFCGCGTTLAAARKLDRRWIGIDSNSDALRVTSDRLRESFPGIRIRIEDLLAATADI
ncbi:MAG: site-specific DNA-methyltransferase [Dehalococcoidales bacterium]